MSQYLFSLTHFITSWALNLFSPVSVERSNGLSVRTVLNGAKCLMMFFYHQDGPAPITCGIPKGTITFHCCEPLLSSLIMNIWTSIIALIYAIIYLSIYFFISVCREKTNLLLIF